jgi:glycerol kinase
LSYLLAIDQGTTSTRAIVFSNEFNVVAAAQQEFPQHYPQSGWVEHAPEDLWQTVVQTMRAAVQAAGISPGEIAGIGITNQRETTLIWDRQTGAPLHNAIVWQDRRTSDHCARLKLEGHEPLIRDKTGLLLDPYFSATKLAWLLDNVPGARAQAERGELAAGTVDAYLVWRLTGGRRHVTDATNASRTLLMDIGAGVWDADLCRLFGVPMSLLPEILDSAAAFGMTDPDILGIPVPVLGIAGDQQAAAIGQACFAPGMLKATYGTGCFALLNTGSEKVLSHNRMLTTIACQLDGQRTYAIEGSIFVAGAVVQWLRDGVHMIGRSDEAQKLSEAADPNQDLVLVPAFTGLGAPYWQPQSRGAIFGLSRNSGPAEFARAALESVGFQTRDLLDAMQRDWPGRPLSRIRVDGGMTASPWTMQFIADITGLEVDRPKIIETTALGAAYLAGLKAGVAPAPTAFASTWKLDRTFRPALAAADRDRRYGRWLKAIEATIAFAE